MQLHYYVKREKCKVNDVIFPSGCQARAINLGNKNMKIGIFTGGTRVRLKNIFTDISRYPTGKHEIIPASSLFSQEGISVWVLAQNWLPNEHSQNTTKKVMRDIMVLRMFLGYLSLLCVLPFWTVNPLSDNKF